MKRCSKRRVKMKNRENRQRIMWKSCVFFLVIVMMSILTCPTCKTFRKNDFARYSVTAIVVPVEDAVNETLKKIIQYYEDINNTVWNLTIEYVNYPEFKISVKKPLNNGSLVEDFHEGNVETGDSDLNMWFVSANLSKGEPIYRLNYSEKVPRVKNEGIFEFANLTRKTVYANFSQFENGIYSHFGVFWDKKTGVLCGMSSIQQYLDKDLNIVLNAMTNIKIIETTMWSEKDYPDLGEQNWSWRIYLIPLAIISLIFLLFLVKMRKKKIVKRKK
jgi:hypothetical protein